jgi:CRISPR-associated endoribonuclease Cas6
MRIKVIFRFEGQCKLTYNYQYYLNSLIYHALELGDICYSKNLHDKGIEVEGKKLKPFLLSPIFFNRTSKFFPKHILTKGENYFHVSSMEQGFLFNLMNGIWRLDKPRLGEYRISIERISFHPLEDWENSIYFYALSPVVAPIQIEEHGVKRLVFLQPEDDKYWKILLQNLERKWKLCYPERKFPGCCFELDRDKRMKEKLITYKGKNIKGYCYNFKIFASKEVKEVIQVLGLGSYSAQGFGYIIEAKEG